jgi:riboflavin synthase
MFTGIIEKIGKIKKVAIKNQSLFVDIILPANWRLKEGESVSINGICSTVKKVSKKIFMVEYMPETISKTTVSGWSGNSIVNLERSLKMNDFIDGHLVFGHIDQKAKIINIDLKGDSKVFTIKTQKELMKYIAPKGSVALDGVSLTVIDVLKDCFTVSLVSYTLLNTNLGYKKAGESINIETDIIAKYIFNILKDNIYAKRKK